MTVMPELYFIFRRPHMELPGACAPDAIRGTATGRSRFCCFWCLAGKDRQTKNNTANHSLTGLSGEAGACASVATWPSPASEGGV